MICKDHKRQLLLIYSKVINRPGFNDAANTDAIYCIFPYVCVRELF